jgi:hypothetical protein
MPQVEKPIRSLKERFTTAPVLSHYNPKRQCIVETEASGFPLGAVLSQKGLNDILHLIAYPSRKFSPPEINYEILKISRKEIKSLDICKDGHVENPPVMVGL